MWEPRRYEVTCFLPCNFLCSWDLARSADRLLAILSVAFFMLRAATIAWSSFLLISSSWGQATNHSVHQSVYQPITMSINYTFTQTIILWNDQLFKPMTLSIYWAYSRSIKLSIVIFHLL